MSDVENKRQPWGDAFAVVERAEGESSWLNLGAVWKAESGALSFTLDVEPIAWRVPACKRRLVLQPRRERTEPVAAASTEPKGKRK
jgi:hypothetical protein